MSRRGGGSKSSFARPRSWSPALAAGVAHDFNNLLTVIQGNVSLLQERFGFESEPGEPGELLVQVADAATSGATLTRQLLLFSRKEHTSSI